MKKTLGKQLLGGLAALFFSSAGVLQGQGEKAAPEPLPIKALLVTGGASHDYTLRKEILVGGIRERVRRPIEWTVRLQGEGESEVRIPVFEGADWAVGYDIVVHDYCFPRVTDRAYVDRILAPHLAGLPAVLVHGTMHSFRTGDERWFDFCGATSRGHGKSHDFSVAPAPGGNPIVAGMSPWFIPRGELYRIERLHPGVTPLTFSQEEGGAKVATTWTHLYGPVKTKVFATTLGNETATLLTPAYLDMLTRGFLWALDSLVEGTFVPVAAADSLSSLAHAPAPATLPRPGPNYASRGFASALSIGQGEFFTAEKAIDGDPETYWDAGEAGPSSWQVDLRKSQAVGAILLVWKDGAPERCQIECSPDSLDWQILFEGEGGGSAPLTVGFDPLAMRYLRVTIPETKPGEVPGLREVAAYRTMDEMPAAFPDFRTINGSPRADLAAASSREEGVMRRLAPGWSAAPICRLPEGKAVVRIIPAASGRAFLLCVDEACGVRSLHMASPVEEGRLKFWELLGDLPPGTEAAWDGEWLYTLNGADLTAYRDTDGDGRIDDRSRIGPIFSPTAGPPLPAISYSRLQTGPDGWFYAIANAAEEVSGFNAGHEPVLMPRHGLVRFRRNAGDLGILASSPTALEDIQFGREGRIFVRRAVEHRLFDGSGLHLLTPLPGRTWRETPALSWPPSSDHDSRWGALDLFADHDRIHADTGEGRLEVIAEIEGLSSFAGDGERIWVSGKEAGREVLTFLTQASQPPTPGVDWDRLATRNLFPYLASPNRAVRAEAVFEILRRKYRPTKDLEKWLLTDLPAPAVEGILATLSASGEGRALEVLVETAASPDPLRQSLAFRHLGDHPKLKNHEIFGEISRSTVPAVSAEILSAMERTGTSIPGLEELVLSFASHPDVTLAATARAFLQARGAAIVCFDRLEDESQTTARSTAFSVLSGIRRASVVERIVLLLEKTGSAEIRALGLETLVALYYDDSAERRPWEGTPMADLFLRASLLDHRVDRGKLLRQMKAAGLPSPAPGVLLELGESSIPLEACVIDAFDSGNDPLPDGAMAWLDSIFRSSARDTALRGRALGLLVRDAGGMDYRKRFEMVSSFLDLEGAPESGHQLIRRWIAREDHPEKADWLVEQSRNPGENKALLAWITLGEILKRGDIPPETSGIIEGRVDDVLNGPEPGMTSLLRSVPWAAGPLADEILQHVAVAGGEALRARARAIVIERSFLASNAGDATMASGREAAALLMTGNTPPADPVVGKQFFRSLSCGACHNIHGEGPAFAPDLASSARQRSVPELIKAILSPSLQVTPGYAATLFELTGGRRLTAYEEGRNADGIVLRDRVGNSFSLAPVQVRRESPLKEGTMVCEAAVELPVRDFAALLAYLVSLGE